MFIVQKSTIQKSGFFPDSVATNDEPMLLNIEDKWLETIVHTAKSEFLDLLCPKQFQLLISTCIHGKFRLSPMFALIRFQKDIQQFIPQRETSLKCESLVAPLLIIRSDNVQRSVKHKLDFDESKSISKQNLLEINFLCDLCIVTFSIQIFYVCGNSLYQNFGLNNLYYTIIFIVFFLEEKESFHTSILHQVPNINLNATFLYVKQFFNESNFSMQVIFQCK
jgi:hypothetical protein